jgi:dethiobiotin synthetase
VQRIVVLGTGTEIGKTWIGESVLLELTRRRLPALGLKPVESGVDAEDPARSSDAGRLRAAGQPGAPPLHLHAFSEPVSPHLCARREGLPIELEDVARWVSAQEATLPKDDTTRHVVSLIETAGGVFSPLGPALTNVELAAALDPAIWVLVAPDRLGVLHDVTAALLALASLEHRVDLVILSAPAEPDGSTGRNAAELSDLVFPRLGAAAPRDPEVQSLARGARDVGRLVDRLVALAR